jgi:hypothetical protein
MAEETTVMHFREELVAPCGANCNICAGYRARLADAKAQGVRMAYCAGCRPRGKQCALLKKRCGIMPEGNGRYCYECGAFPCGNLKKIDERYRMHYRMSMLENLEFIKRNGIKEFLLNEEKRWRCLRCGGTISCHNGLCFECDMEKLKTLKHKYRWE